MPHDVCKGNIVLFHEKTHKIPRIFHGLRRKTILFALFPAAKLDAETVRVAAVRMEIHPSRAAVPRNILFAPRLPDLFLIHEKVCGHARRFPCEVIRVVFRGIAVVRRKMNDEIADIRCRAVGNTVIFHPRCLELCIHASVPSFPQENTPAYIDRFGAKIDLKRSSGMKNFQFSALFLTPDFGFFC